MNNNLTPTNQVQTRQAATSKTPSTTQKPSSEACPTPGLEITIESLNYQLRKIIKNRGHFPNDTAVVKLLWLAIRDIEDKRARQRGKKRKTDKETTGRHLVEGASSLGWNAALGALALAYPDRLAGHLQ